MYTRASASDYDDFQAKGWETKNLIPLMKKHRNPSSGRLITGTCDEVPMGTQFGNQQLLISPRELHGSEGPIQVSFGNYTYPVKEDFLRAPEVPGASRLSTTRRTSPPGMVPSTGRNGSTAM